MPISEKECKDFFEKSKIMVQEAFEKMDKEKIEYIQKTDTEQLRRDLEDYRNKTRQFDTGSIRDTHEGKGRCDLLPACSLLRLAKHYETGANKYGARNWEKGQPISVLMDSGIRHLLNYLDGKMDEDHLAAAAWNILGAMWMEEKKPEMQDIEVRKNTRFHNGKSYIKIDFLLGGTIDRAIKKLLKYNEEGVLAFGYFNGIYLYSDEVNIEDAYKQITGITKEEFDNRYNNKEGCTHD
jgi:hypothetical protein